MLAFGLYSQCPDQLPLVLNIFCIDTCFMHVALSTKLDCLVVIHIQGLNQANIELSSLLRLSVN